MKLLLIAYEFPPSASPQSLRWAYLSRELHKLGHEIQVLTIHLGGDTPGLPELSEGIVVHRTFAGPVRGLLAAMRDRRAARAEAPTGQTGKQQALKLRPPRSWKQSLSETLQAMAARFVFPDVRGEWKPWARQRLMRLLDGYQPDVVISSHEPATTLELGLLAKQRGVAWIADLGDPVVAPYTPSHWLAKARLLEDQVCKMADHLLVTTHLAAEQIRRLHGRHEGISLVRQGFQAQAAQERARPTLFDLQRLELLYTGSFYSFRRPDALLAALSRYPRARLNIASVTVPDSLLAAAARMPDQIRLLGFIPHATALELQRGADVLVNIANEDPQQVPGKIYEYFGAQRPILHLGSTSDAIADLLEDLQRGWFCPNEAGAIMHRLSDLDEAHSRQPHGDYGTRLDLDSVMSSSWGNRAHEIDRILGTLDKHH